MLYVRHMIRTQVYLTENQYHSINLLAGREKKPAAQLIRELLERGLEQKNQITAKDALLEFVKIGKKTGMTGPTDLSTNIDKYLYEE